MGNEHSNPDAGSVRNSLTSSQQLSASRMVKSSRKVPESKLSVMHNNFTESTTEVEKLLELAGLYQLTRNEFAPSGLLSPFNCEPFAASMRESGQEFEEAHKGFVDRTRQRINRVQRRTRRTLIQDLDATTELDAMLFNLSNHELPVYQPGKSGSKDNTRYPEQIDKARQDQQNDDFVDYLPPPPAPIQPAVKEKQVSHPHIPATKPEIPPKTQEQEVKQPPRLLNEPKESKDSKDSKGSKGSKESKESKEPKPTNRQVSPNISLMNKSDELAQPQRHPEPIEEDPPEKVQQPYSVEQFEPYSDESSEEDHHRKLAPKKMSSIMEHSVEDDSEHHDQDSLDRDPSPPSRTISKRFSKKDDPQEHRSPRSKRSVPIPSVDTNVPLTSPRHKEPAPLAPVPEQSRSSKQSITSISVKGPNKEQLQTQSKKVETKKRQQPTTSVDKGDAVLEQHFSELSRIDKEIKEAEDNFQHLLEQSIDFQAILQKYKLTPIGNERQQPCKRFVMGPVVDMPVIQ